MSVALSMDGAFGFGLQAAKGVYLAPTTWLPLMADSDTPVDTVEWKKNYVMLDMADGKDYQTSYYSAGEWAEGRLRFPVIPGSVSQLFAWIQDRDGDNQGKWASALIDCVHEVKKLTDLKVGKAVFDLVKGEPVTCTLEVAGLKMESGGTANPVMPLSAPYLFREAKVELSVGGQAVAEDANCEAIRIEINTMLEDPAEGLRLGETGNPTQLYNLAGLRCTGSLSRDFVDAAVYGDFVAGQEAALVLTLERDVTVATIQLPRVLYSGSDLGLPGSHARRIVEEVSFVALGSADGLTPPVVLA